jgi:hypothetical protein
VDSTVRFVEDGREAADGEFTHVVVRLKTPELEMGMTTPDSRIVLRGGQIGLANDPIVDHPGQPADYVHTHGTVWTCAWTRFARSWIALTQRR